MVVQLAYLKLIAGQFGDHRRQVLKRRGFITVALFLARVAAHGKPEAALKACPGGSALECVSPRMVRTDAGVINAERSYPHAELVARLDPCPLRGLVALAPMLALASFRRALGS